MVLNDLKMTFEEPDSMLW